MHYRVIESADISYLEDILLERGTLQVVPYETLQGVPQDHIAQFCVQHGYYCIPTQELIDYLKIMIKGQEAKTLEIASGCGIIGRELGIIATDNHMQRMPKYKKIYEETQQAIVPYGPDVLPLSAIDAIKIYKPKIVIGAWVTHKFNPATPEIGGNEIGVNEKILLRKVKKYVHIGNAAIHGFKPILKERHINLSPHWLVSRSQYIDDNIIQIWNR